MVITVFSEWFVSLQSKSLSQIISNCIFLHKFIGKQTAIMWIRWPSLRVVILGHPHLFWVQWESFNFTVASYADVSLTCSFLIIFLSGWPSLYKITIWACLVSLNYALSAHFSWQKSRGEYKQSPCNCDYTDNLAAAVSLERQQKDIRDDETDVRSKLYFQRAGQTFAIVFTAYHELILKNIVLNLYVARNKSVCKRANRLQLHWELNLQ